MMRSNSHMAKIKTLNTVALLIAVLLSVTPALADVRLGASPVATYVDDEGEPARLNAIVLAAFEKMGQKATLVVERSAFLGSDLIAGKLDGEFAYHTLNDEKSGFAYSAPYLPLYLHAVSKQPNVKMMRLVPHLKDSRIAIENQFVNTPRFRLIKEVKWSRNPTTFDAFRQFADDRADFLMTTRLLAEEFNRLLRADDEEETYLSVVPIISAGFKISLNRAYDGADTTLTAFNKAISTMQQDGTYNKLLAIDWLSKDINNDGVADYITASDVMHSSANTDTLIAYPLDGTTPGDGSLYFVDGAEFENKTKALSAISDASTGVRASLLDREVYERILKRW